MTAFAASPAEAQGDLTQFAATPLWLTLIKTLVVFVVLSCYAVHDCFERRVVARLQQRIGPNRVGPQGCCSRSPTAQAGAQGGHHPEAPRTCSSSSWRR